MAQQAPPAQVRSARRLTKPLLQRAFDLIDKNGDGKLQKDEFSSGCDSMGFGLSAEQSDAVFALIDDDGSGEIDFDEFCAFVLNEKADDSKELQEFRARLICIVGEVSKETLRNAFDCIDKNGDGELQKSEFMEGCASMGIELDVAELTKVFECIDIDGSGEIDFDEFASFLQPGNKDKAASNREFGQFRQSLMRLLHGDEFEDYYHFQVADVIVLRLFSGKRLCVDDSGKALQSEEKEDPQNLKAQFVAELIDDGKVAYLASMATGEFIKLAGETLALGAKDDNAKWRVRRISIGNYKLESVAKAGAYLSVNIKSGAVTVGNGCPMCGLKALRKGRKPLFSDPYTFAMKGTVVLEHRRAQHFRVSDESGTELKAEGGKGTLAQFEATPSEGGKLVTFKNAANGKFLRVTGEQVDVGGEDGDSDEAKFRVHVAGGPNHVRLESVQAAGSFLACDENGVCLGKGEKPSLVTVYKN